MQTPELVGYDQGCPQSQPPSDLNDCNQIIVCQQATPTTKVVYGNYKGYQSKFIGVGLIIIGVLCIIFSAVSLGVASYSYDYKIFTWAFPGQGFWGGLLMIVTGSFGIIEEESKSKCRIVAFMVLCIVSSAAAWVIFALGISDAYDYGRNSSYSMSEAATTVFAMGILLAILGDLGAALCIWGIVLCCHALYRRAEPNSGNFAQLNGPQQMVLVAAPSPAGQQQITASPGYPMPVISNYQMQVVPNAQMQIVSGARETFASGYDQPRDHNPGQVNNTFIDEIPRKSAY